MESLTLDELRALARVQGLDLTEPELARLLPLVQAARSMMETLRDVLPRDAEPGSQYRVL